jgi:hypothetical protein
MISFLHRVLGLSDPRLGAKRCKMRTTPGSAARARPALTVAAFSAQAPAEFR